MTDYLKYMYWGIRKCYSYEKATFCSGKDNKLTVIAFGQIWADKATQCKKYNHNFRKAKK